MFPMFLQTLFCIFMATLPSRLLLFTFVKIENLIDLQLFVLTLHIPFN